MRTLFLEIVQFNDRLSEQAAELNTLTNSIMLAAAKSALGWQAHVDSVKMLRLIGNLRAGLTIRKESLLV